MIPILPNSSQNITNRRHSPLLNRQQSYYTDQWHLTDQCCVFFHYIATVLFSSVAKYVLLQKYVYFSFLNPFS